MGQHRTRPQTKRNSIKQVIPIQKYDITISDEKKIYRLEKSKLEMSHSENILQQKSRKSKPTRIREKHQHAKYLLEKPKKEKKSVLIGPVTRQTRLEDFSIFTSVSSNCTCLASPCCNRDRI